MLVVIQGTLLHQADAVFKSLRRRRADARLERSGDGHCDRGIVWWAHWLSDSDRYLT